MRGTHNSRADKPVALIKIKVQKQIKVIQTAKSYIQRFFLKPLSGGLNRIFEIHHF